MYDYKAEVTRQPHHTCNKIQSACRVLLARSSRAGDSSPIGPRRPGLLALAPPQTCLSSFCLFCVTILFSL